MKSSILAAALKSVVSALLERRRRGEKGGVATDGRKIGLVVEGGAMCGVISAGGVCGLEKLGLTDAFDEIYGCSAGAVNAGYFLAGQAAYGTTIYYEDINNANFINPARFWRIVDIDYLFHHVIPRVKPLRQERILASPTRFMIPLTDACTGEGFLVHAQESRADLITLFRASSAAPVLYNGTIAVEGRPCMDGGWVNPIPVEDALRSGCTDVLVLLTHPARFVEPALTPAQLWLYGLMCARGSVRLSQVAGTIHTLANSARDLAFGRRPVPAGASIAVLCPDEDETPVAWTTRDGAALRSAAEAAERRVLAAFA